MPVRDQPSGALSRLIRWFPVLLVPLLPLASLALWQRVDQYGWTEFRYARAAILAALALLAIVGAIRPLRRGPPLLASIVVVPAALLLLVSLGPWSAPAVSERDQHDRLLASLAEAGFEAPRERRALLVAGADTTLLDSAVYSGIAGSARYLLDAHGPRALRPVFGTLPDSIRNGWTLVAALALREDPCSRTVAPQQRFGAVGEANWSEGILLPAGRLYRFEVYRGDTAIVGAYSLWIGAGGNRLFAVTGGENPAATDLAPLLRSSFLLSDAAACAAGETSLSGVRGAKPGAVPIGERVLVIAGAAGQSPLTVIIERIFPDWQGALSSGDRRDAVQFARDSLRVERVEGLLLVP